MEAAPMISGGKGCVCVYGAGGGAKEYGIAHVWDFQARSHSGPIPDRATTSTAAPPAWLRGYVDAGIQSLSRWAGRWLSKDRPKLGTDELAAFADPSS